MKMLQFCAGIFILFSSAFLDASGQMAATIGSFGLSTLQYALAAAPLAAAIKQTKHKTYDYGPASAEITQFARQELTKCGVANSENINIKIDFTWSTNNDTLFVDHLCVELLEGFLAGKEVDIAEINNIKGIIQHEASHLKHNDYEKKPAIFFGLGCVSICTTIVLSRLTQQYTKALLNQCLKIPSGLGTTLAVFLAYAAYKRLQEQRADNEILNDLAILQARAAHCKKEIELEERGHALNTAWGKDFFEWFASHPTARQRTLKFEERIAKLLSLK